MIHVRFSFDRSLMRRMRSAVQVGALPASPVELIMQHRQASGDVHILAWISDHQGSIEGLMHATVTSLEPVAGGCGQRAEDSGQGCV